MNAAFAQLNTSQQTADAARSYDIPAGPLPAALTRFIGESGISLSGTAELARGKNSPGVHGRYDVQAGLDALLAGSGLAAQPQANGSYLLLQQTNANEVLLKSVKVSAVGLGETSEGTGSYTTGASRSSTGLSLSLRETPQSITVMTRARIEDQGLDEISDVLDQTVGVSFNGTSALGSDGINFYARGFEVKNFQIDGVSRPPAIYGFNETTADMAVYDRVEIVRGATGLLNGAGAPSATVNLIRKHPTAEAKASISAQVGSYDHYRLEADASGPLMEAGNVRGRLVAAYQENRSYLDRMSIDKQVLYGTVEIDLTTNILLTVGAEYQGFKNSAAPRGGLPLFYSNGIETDFSRSSNVGAKWSDFDHETTSLFASLEQRFDNGWLIKLVGEQSRPNYDESIGYMYVYDHIDAATGTGANFLSARWAAELKQNIIDLSASGPFQLFGREHELMLGFSRSVGEDEGDDYPGWWTSTNNYPLANAYDFLESGNEPKPSLAASGYKYGGRVEQTGTYGAVRLSPLDGVSVILGSRISNWKETEWDTYSGIKESRPLTKETGVVTPYAGVVVDLGEHYSVYASYTDIFEPQSNEDVDGHRLDPLEGANYEAGVKADFNGGLVNASAAIFRIEQDNFAVDTGFLNTNGDTIYRAENGTVSTGFELEIAGQVREGWQVGGGFARAKAENSEGERLLSEIPKDTFKLFTSYKLPGLWSDLTIGGNLRWQGKVYVDDAGPNGERFAQDALVTVDLMAKYALTQNLSLAFNAYNLFDKNYYSGVSQNSSAVYGTPRNYMLTAKYSY